MQTHIRIVLLTLVIWGRGICLQQQLLDGALERRVRVILHANLIHSVIKFYRSSEDILRARARAHTLIWSVCITVYLSLLHSLARIIYCIHTEHINTHIRHCCKHLAGKQVHFCICSKDNFPINLKAPAHNFNIYLWQINTED